MSHIVVATINAAGVTSTPARTLENVVRALPGVGIAFVQEAKPLRNAWSLRNHLARRTIGVHQVTTSAATAGCAILWDKSRVTGRRRSITFGVAPGPGDDMLSRHLLAIELTIDETMTVLAIDGHRPPPRHRDLWPAYDRALRDLVESSVHPVLIGTDNNASSMPTNLRPYVVPYARRIDMILLDRELHAHRVPGRPVVYDLPRTRSDHRPVALDLEVTALA